jgi:hypothetical protein
MVSFNNDFNYYNVQTYLTNLVARMEVIKKETTKFFGQSLIIYQTDNRWIVFAKSSVRSVSVDISKYSSSLCAFPPTGPNPSTVGTPFAEVNDASDPPPVAVSDKCSPISSPTSFMIYSNEHVCSFFSIGGRLMSPLSSIFVPGTSVVANNLNECTYYNSKLDHLLNLKAFSFIPLELVFVQIFLH